MVEKESTAALKGKKGKQRILKLLAAEDLDRILTELTAFSPRRLIHPLIAGLCSTNETTRWQAVSALGPVTAALATADFEAARVVMRRLMWSLNDESGGIGWGAPEAMAEIMACHAGLAGEFAHILVAYMRPDGGFLELETLQRGLLWGVGRLAEVRPALLQTKEASRYLPPYLAAADATVRGLAARALGLLQAGAAAPALKPLLSDHRPLRLYQDRRLTTTTVSDLAAEALGRLTDDG